jgi:hypothetical protein
MGDRHLAEIDDGPQIGRMAEPAMIAHGLDLTNLDLAAFRKMSAASEASCAM